MARRFQISALAFALIATLLAGCASPTQGAQAGGETGPSDTAPDHTDEEPGAGEGDARGLAEVVAALEGLSPDARRTQLISLAEAEGGSLSVYGSTNYATMSPLFDLFQEETGISVDFYRAASPTVLTRVVQEAQADSSGADVVILNGVEMVAMAEEGLSLAVDTPVADELVPSALNDTWFGFYIIAYTAGWNTDLIATPPTSWEQVLAEYPGQLALQAGDWDWFGTLVERYFIAEQGLTEPRYTDEVQPG